MVKEVWERNIHGVEQYKLCRRLKQLKQPLKKLNQLHYSHISLRAERATKEFEDMQVALQGDLKNKELQADISRQMGKAQFLCEAERSFLSQKAKCEYTHLMDKSKKFFFAMVKKKAKRNHIVAVVKEDGNWTESSQEVAAFIRFYKNLLGEEFFFLGLCLQCRRNDCFCRPYEELPYDNGSSLTRAKETNSIKHSDINPNSLISSSSFLLPTRNGPF